MAASPDGSKAFAPIDWDLTVSSSLCLVCDSLGLSIQRFVVSNTPAAGDASSDPGSVDSPTSSRGPRRVRGGESGNVRLNWGNPRNPFASFSELRARREECRFCELTTRAIERYSGNQINETATLSLRWEFDSWENAKSPAPNRTRRIRLAWRERNGREMVVYLLFVGSTLAAQSFTSDASASMTEKQELMKGWVDSCVANHGHGCQETHGNGLDFWDLVKGTYFGVIDVHDMQLKALPMIGDKPSRYVALSYVWGKNTKDIYMTKRSNVMLHIQHNGLQKAWDKLPRTIQDAILLARQLDERYLWVDSLCIVQDSNRSWEQNARSMHMVYGNAHFTICAADGDADAGLMVVGEQDGEAGRCFPSLMEEVLPGIRLLATRPAEAILQDSCWGQRGWTFQERLLSRRCLIFANHQLYFQCRSSVASQHTSSSINGVARNWSLDWANSPTRMLRELHRKTFWFYMNSVALYTGRRLTKSKDVLAAFSGISWLLQKHMNAPLLYGLPTSHFDLALLWTPSERLELRRRNGRTVKGAAGCTWDEVGNCTCRPEEEDYGNAEFPSWSWAGWQGGKAEYRSDILEGALGDVQEWLKHHTWIQWYVRDREGNLRPLWDKLVFNLDGSEMSSWRGYAGKSPSSPTYATQANTRFPGAHGAPQALPKGDESRCLPYQMSSGGPMTQQQTPQQQMAQLQMAQMQMAHNQMQQQKMMAQYAMQRHQSSLQQSALQPTPLGSAPLPNGENAPILQHQQASGSVLSGSVAASASANRGLVSLDLTQSSGLHGSVPASPQLFWDGTCRPNPVVTHNNDELASRRATGPNIGREGTNDEDDYGRPLRETLKGRNTSNFTGVLPENPFGNFQKPFPEQGTDHAYSMPILQFWTWRTELALVQCDIADKSGDWCGAIALPSAGVTALSESAAADLPFHFVALSEAKAFTADECPEWNYYNSTEREDSEWDLYFVMLLQRNEVTALWERVAVGKVLQAAFQDAKWSEVKLG